MTTGNMGGGSHCLPRPAVMLLLATAILSMVGCAPLSRNRAQVSVQRSPSGAEKSPVGALRGNSSSLAAIVNEQIQRGRYADGERALRQYLVEHPGDAAARAMLHQLTVDPARMLGSDARDYSVRPGDSYSSLASHYLGDASLFVVLARYNGSDNPSDLRVGQNVRLPLAPPGAGETMTGPVVDTPPAPETNRMPTASTTDASPEAKARRMQDESVVLLQQGKKQAALRRLDQALLVQPKLKSNGREASSLRKQLVTNFHEQAVVLYRDQKLDPAIALWDRVLAIDPGFEPAIIYRTRALELKKRLKQL